MRRFRMRDILGVLGVLSAWILAAPAGAETTAQTQPAVQGRPPGQTLRGEIVDPASYLKDGAHGSKQADQSYEAVDGGQTLALLEAGTDTLYLLVAEEPGEDPNELAYDYVNQEVKLTGRVLERGGMHGIIPSAVEPLNPPTPTASQPAPATTTATQ